MFHSELLFSPLYYIPIQVQELQKILLTLKGREFHIRNKTTHTGNGRSSVYGTKPKNEGKWCKNDFIQSGLYNTDKAFVSYKYRREGVLDRGERERERVFVKKKKKK